MSAPAPAGARAAYRTLLRAVARRVTALSGNTLWRDAVRAQFRLGAAETDPAAAAAAVARAEDVAFMIDSVNEHKDLLVSYGISIDKDAQTKDRVKHTAARVGLSVAEYDEHGALKPNAADTVKKRT